MASAAAPPWGSSWPSSFPSGSGPWSNFPHPPFANPTAATVTITASATSGAVSSIKAGSATSEHPSRVSAQGTTAEAASSGSPTIVTSTASSASLTSTPSASSATAAHAQRHTTNHHAAVIGGPVVGVLLLLLLIMVWYLRRRRTSHRASVSAMSAAPYSTHQSESLGGVSTSHAEKQGSVASGPNLLSGPADNTSDPMAAAYDALPPTPAVPLGSNIPEIAPLPPAFTESSALNGRERPKRGASAIIARHFPPRRTATDRNTAPVVQSTPRMLEDGGVRLAIGAGVDDDDLPPAYRRHY